MRVHAEEPESFRELFYLREAVHNQFIRIEKNLIGKKENLFKGSEPTKWGSGPFSCFKDEKQVNDLREKLLADKTFAFTYMLPKETQEYE